VRERHVLQRDQLMTEALVAKWAEAKRNKDYKTADAIRETLRAKGIEPEKLRSGSTGSTSAGGKHQQKIQEWRDAKKSKDYTRADELRAELRAEGVDPDKPQWQGGGDGGLYMEWLAAKEKKDYATADKLRVQLRKEGFDPDSPGSRGMSGQDKATMMVSQWQAAKEARNYGLADTIREQLREIGVDPDPSSRGGPGVAAMAPFSGFAPVGPRQAWPSPYAMQAPARTPPALASAMMQAAEMAQPYDPQVEADLDAWLEAKSAKNWAYADQLRGSLRELGLEPDKLRPYPVTVESELMQWQRAKKAKDYDRSDRLRDSLREKGVDPDASSRGGGGLAMMGGMMGMAMGAPVGLGPGFGKLPPARSSQRSSPYGRQQSPEAMMQEWKDLRARNDFGKADALREKLRAMGLDPR